MHSVKSWNVQQDFVVDNFFLIIFQVTTTSAEHRSNFISLMFTFPRKSWREGVWEENEFEKTEYKKAKEKKKLIIATKRTYK